MKDILLIDPSADMDYDAEVKRSEGETSIDVSERLLTTQEVSSVLNVPKSYVYYLTAERKIPFIKIGGHLRFRRVEIEAWLRQQEVRCVSIQAGG